MIWPDVLPVLPNDVAFVQQSSSYRSPVLKKGSTCRCQPVKLWEDHSLHSFHSRKGSNQWRVSPSQFWESLSLADTSDLVSRRFFGCWWRLLTASRNPVITRNHFSCSSSGQEWAEHQTTFAMLEEQKIALVRSLASLAHWMGIRAAIQSTVITSTEQRAHMQVSSSDHCERAILSTVSISRRVRSMKSVSFAILRKLEFGRHLRPCVGMSLVADAAVLKLPGLLHLSGITLLVPIPSKNEQSIAQLLPCWKKTSTCDHLC